MRFFYKVCEIESIRRLSYRQDINTLRAVAVLAVVFYHAEFQHFKGGWLGVDVFFVISGFLISNIIISELNNNSFSFKNFYIRRASDASRSGLGIQTDKKVRSARFKNTKYISDLLNRYRKEFEQITI